MHTRTFTQLRTLPNWRNLFVPFMLNVYFYAMPLCNIINSFAENLTVTRFRRLTCILSTRRFRCRARRRRLRLQRLPNFPGNSKKSSSATSTTNNARDSNVFFRRKRSWENLEATTILRSSQNSEPETEVKLKPDLV